MMPSKFIRFRYFLMLLLVLVGLAACNLSGNDPGGQSVVGVTTPMSVLTLHHADSCAEYKQYVADALLEDIQTTPFYYPSPMLLDDRVASAELATASADAASTSRAPTYVSQTNTQEQGVDEADIVEAGADGMLYQLRYGVLHILKGSPPAELGQVGSLDLGIYASAMYLDDANKRIVAIGHQYLAQEPAQRSVQLDSALIAPYPYFARPSLQVFFIDVAEPSAPVLTKQLSIDGDLVDSRRIANRVHLVSSYRRYWPPVLLNDQAFTDILARYWQVQWGQDKAPVVMVAAETSVTQDGAELLALIKAKIDAVVQATDPALLLPATEWVNGDGRNDAALLACGDVMLPDVKMRSSLLTVTSIDSDGENADATAILNNAWQVYASQDRLFIAQGSGGWWWRADQRQQTVIYQFDIGSGTPHYSATGRVDGWVRDAYSFSEYAGHLRLVTTQNEHDDETGAVMTSHAMRVLKDDGAGTLQQVGSVGGFGSGEQVFAVRFIGEQGFVVTFRQIDPLFTFDLGDPLNPQLMGELEIPGFSSYMHPLGDGYLLTIGRSGNAAGVTNGVQLQIFDVSDLSKPRKIHGYDLDAGVSGYNWSAASYDPHAFTFYAEQGLLAIPLSAWDYPNGKRFNGIVALSIDVEKGIAELGRVDHSDLAYQMYCGVPPASDDWRYSYCQEGGVDWWSYPRRSVFMTDAVGSYLFSLSDSGVKATLAREPNVVVGSHVYPIWNNQPISIVTTDQFTTQ